MIRDEKLLLNGKWKELTQEYYALSSDGTTVAAKTKGDKTIAKSDKSIVYTFVTFRSMKAMAILERAYNYSFWRRTGIKCCGCCPCLKKKYQKIKLREFYGNWPYPETRTSLPDNVLWENMGVSDCSRRLR
jgi:hypothetical protein